jgi:hypothetical protein
MNIESEILNATPPPEAPRLLKMRCPSCNKLYSVEEAWVDAPARAALRFECVSCKSRFEAKRMRPDAMILETLEVPVSVPKSRQQVPGKKTVERTALRSVPLRESPRPLLETRKCPKCGVEAALNAEECKECGVVFAKFKSTEHLPAGEVRLEGRREILELWDEVLANYADESYHERFVMACYTTNTLAFAAQKYARILSASGNEEIARKMRKKIVGLASFKTEIRGSDGIYRFRSPLLLNLILVLAGAATTIGLLLPKMKNLTGIGLATIALAMGVRYFLRPPRT